MLCATLSTSFGPRNLFLTTTIIVIMFTVFIQVGASSCTSVALIIIIFNIEITTLDRIKCIDRQNIKSITDTCQYRNWHSMRSLLQTNL